jgi:hypothetical protein
MPIDRQIIGRSTDALPSRSRRPAPCAAGIERHRRGKWQMPRRRGYLVEIQALGDQKSYIAGSR